MPPQLKIQNALKAPQAGSDPINSSKAGLHQDMETQGKLFRFTPAALRKQVMKLRTYMN